MAGPDDQQPSLGKAVRQLRDAKGWTQEELGDRAGIHMTWIRRIERGKTNPSWSTSKRIAQAFGIPHTELAAREEAIAGHGGAAGS